MDAFDVLVESKEPLTLEQIAKLSKSTKEDVEKKLNEKLESGEIRKREILDGTRNISIYWTAMHIPFLQTDSIITSPFSESFDPDEALKFVDDSRLTQEKVSMQKKLCKLNEERSNLSYRMNHKISADEEKEIDEDIEKWISACQEMLYEIRSIMRKRGVDITIGKIIKDLKLDPKLIRWDSDEEDFN